MPHIVLQTDFGESDPGIIQLYGVCKSIAPEIETFGLSHAIPRFDVGEASRALAGQVPYWPEETIFVSAVVDPAHPAGRSLCVAKSQNNRYFVVPDNGSLHDVKQRFGIEWARDISALRAGYWENRAGRLCHGRDIAFCAALVAKQLPNILAGEPYHCDEIIR